MHYLLVSRSFATADPLQAPLRRRGCSLEAAQDTPAVLRRLEADVPDVILVDAGMPDSPLLLQHCLRAALPCVRAAIVSSDAGETLVRLINEGAVQYVLTHPVDDAQANAFVGWVEMTRLAQRERQNWMTCLETRVTSQTQRADKAFEDLVTALVMALDLRENESAYHSRRVALMCLYFAIEVGVEPNNFDAIFQGALLHDLGKIGICDAILLKPDKLTPEEREVMETHVAIGVRLLNEVDRLRESLAIPRYHHERFDGLGYPGERSGADIPLAARLFSIVDVYDALRSERPYKRCMGHEDAIDVILRGAGTQFDPELVAGFTDLSPTVYAHLSHAAAAVRGFTGAMLVCQRVRQIVQTADAGVPERKETALWFLGELEGSAERAAGPSRSAQTDGGQAVGAPV